MSLLSNQNIIIIIWKGPRLTTCYASWKKKALMAAFDYLNGKGIEVATLVFDGLMIYKNDLTDIARILMGWGVVGWCQGAG